MKPIDGDALEEIVRAGLKEVPHNDGLARRHHKAEHIHFLDLIRRAPTIAPPPNDPLTLEELREMDGEPVWVCKPNGTNGVWGLVDLEYQMVRLHGGGMAIWENNDKSWLAYRRKLEGPA